MRNMRTQLPLLIGSALAVGFTTAPSHAALWSDGAALGDASLTIDGNMSDWTGEMLVGSDLDEEDVPLGRDLADFYLANDETYLYGRYTLHGQVSTNTNFQLYYIFDTDNDRSTGFPFNRFAGNSGTVSEGNERELRMSLGVDGTVWDQLYDDVDGDPATNPTQIDSDFVGAVDTSTPPSGREWRISLADLGITGNTTISYYVIQDHAGDIFGGNTWNDAAPTFQTYQLVVPEPASLALTAAGGGLMLLRRRSRG